MKRIFYCFVLLMVVYRPSFAQEQELKSFIKDYGIPGIQLVCIKGNKVQNFNLGVISKGSDKRVTANTVFEAASLSKCVFSYIVMRLYDRGVINLDTPLTQYLQTYDRFDPLDPRYAR